MSKGRGGITGLCSGHFLALSAMRPTRSAQATEFRPLRGVVRKVLKSDDV